MHRHELLKSLHERLRPRTYLEIGVADGRSMSLSRTRSIGIDPAYAITSEILCDVFLARTTSDEFFVRPQPLAHFDEPVIDLAFIDGMHLAEYALRDLINVERFTSATSVIVIDDMLPRSVHEARRDRGAPGPEPWTGDVYKLTESVRRLRPDAVWLEIDTAPTGTVIMLLPDREATALPTAYHQLVQEYVVDDPQPVPPGVMNRVDAIDPQRLLAAPILDALRQLRGKGRAAARAGAREAIAGAGLLIP